MRNRIRVFISHSTDDNAIADEVRARLEAQGFPAPFLDYHPETGIPAGHDWEHDIYRQLKRAAAIVYLGSNKAAESKWCFAELAFARSAGRPIFPLRIEGEAGHVLLAGTQWTDFRADKEEGYRRLFRGMKAFGFDPDNTFDWSAGRSPYPGLSAFEEPDAAVFFGRDEETEALFQRVNNAHLEGGERFITVIGASGSGKSSLVRAGLLPRIRRIGAPWLVVDPMIPSTEPLEMLARSFAKTLRAQGRKIEWPDVLKTLETPGRGLISVARDLLDWGSSQHKLVLIFIDQGEELVTRAAGTARVRCARVIKDALDGPDVIRVVTTLRSEFLTRVLQQTELADFIPEPFLLAPLPRSRLALAVSGPAEVAGIELPPSLVEQIVEDTGGGDALPLMAFTMERLYQRLAEKAEKRLDEEDYRAVGGVTGALEQRANGIRDRLAREGSKDDIMPTLLKLVGFDSQSVPTRRRVPLSEMNDQERKILKAFEDARLISVDGAGAAAVAFVAHEALFRAWAPFAEGIEANLEALRERSRIERDAHEWVEAGRDDAYLLRGERLQKASQLCAGAPSSSKDVSVVNEFVEASRSLLARTLGREADLLANRIIKEHREDPERAMLILLAAIEAYEKRPRLQLALSYAVHAPGKRFRREAERLNTLALSPDGCLVAAGRAHGSVIVADDRSDGVQWETTIGDPESGSESVIEGHHVTVLAFGASGEFLAAARGDDSSIFLLDPQTGRTMGTLEAGVPIAAIHCSRNLVAATAGETLRIWDAAAPYKLRSEIVRPQPDKFRFTYRSGLGTGPIVQPIKRVRIAKGEARLAFATRKYTFVVDLGYEFVSGRSKAQRSARLVARGEEITEIEISADGKQLALADGTTVTVRAIVEEGKADPSPMRQIDVEKYVGFLGFTAERRLITGDWARGLRVWDLDTGAEVGAVMPQESSITYMAMSEDGSRVATIRDRKTFSVWHTPENAARLRVRIGDAFSSARFAGKRGEYLVTRSSEYTPTVTLRDSRTGAKIKDVQTDRAIASNISVSPDGGLVAINEKSGVVCRSIPDLEQVRLLAMDGPNHVVFDRSGTHGIVTANFDGDIQSWQSDEPKTLVNVGEFYAGSLSLAPDGKHLLVASGGVRLLDLATGAQIFSYEVEKFGNLHAAIAPDGGCIAIGQGSRLWTLNMDGSSRLEFAWGKYNATTNYGPDVDHLVFSPDSTRLATSTAEGWIYVWDVASGELIQLMRVDNQPLKDLAFSPSGQEIVTCTATFEGEYDSTGHAEVWPAPDVDALIALARRRTFRPVTAEELAQYGLAEQGATGSAASIFHLTRS
jgi:WD40 repeat protein